MVFTLEGHNLFLNVHFKVIFLFYIMQYLLVWLTESHFLSMQKWLIICIQLWLESSALKWNFLWLGFAMLSLPCKYWYLKGPSDVAFPILLHWLKVVCLSLSSAIHIYIYIYWYRNCVTLIRWLGQPIAVEHSIVCSRDTSDAMVQSANEIWIHRSYVYWTMHHCDSWRIRDPTWCHQ
jgi:hypothetical protein